MGEFFTSKDQIFFYTRFFINKRRIFTDTKNNRTQLFLVEILWVFRRILRLDASSSFLIYKDYYNTKYGKYRIHKDLESAITVSPTFEIDDREELISLIDKFVKRKQKILVIDVGASIGDYSISIGRQFRNYKKIDIIAFEPNANNFYEDNYAILLENIKLNNLSNIKVYKIALGSKNSNMPNKFGLYTKKLDSVLGIEFSKKYDVVFIKIDIEGFEEDALRGAELFIKNSNKTYLLLEDFVNENIYKYLKKNFIFYKKITPYNSFWIK